MEEAVPLKSVQESETKVNVNVNVVQESDAKANVDVADKIESASKDTGAIPKKQTSLKQK